MIKIYQTDNTGKLCLLNLEEVLNDLTTISDLDYKWINMINPTDKEIEFVNEITKVDPESLKAALDEEERARAEKEDDHILILYDIPLMEQEDGYYSYNTIPLGIIVKDKFIITVCLKETGFLQGFTAGRIKNLYTHMRTRFIFQMMYQASKKYLTYLRQIDKASQRIKKDLHISTKNKELIQLMDLENSLVYFSTSLSTNSTVIKRLASTNYLKKYEEDEDLIHDVEVENEQALEMCNIYKDILAGTMDAFASIISNNQNRVIKILTIVTIMLSIPTLIASFFGMNTKVPWQGSLKGFWIVFGISILMTIITGLVFFFRRKDK